MSNENESGNREDNMSQMTGKQTTAKSTSAPSGGSRSLGDVAPARQVNMGKPIAGGFALTVLMIPTVARTAEEVLKLIPQDLREAGLALGATQWRTVAMVVIPAARSGLITAVILGIARVVGETAPLLLTIGGADAINLNPTAGNMSAFPYYVWKNLLIGSENAISRAWLGVFVLMILVLIFFALARYFGAAKGSRK